MYLLGIDNGSTVIKAGLFDYEGKEIAVFGGRVDSNTPQPGYYERNLDEIWAVNIDVIKGVMAKAGISGEEITAIAITGHGNGIHLIDDNGLPVYPSIEGTDSRAVDYVNRWVADGTFDRVLPKTMQSLWPAQPAAILAWLKDNEPAVLKKARWVLMVKDYIRFKITGEVFAELTDMSATSIFNVRDVSYDEDLLHEFGIGDLLEKLPPIKYSTDICGEVTAEVAALTGLQEKTPVAGGFFDVDAAAIATGITDESKMNVIAGTWCNNQYISNKPVVSKDLFMTSVYAKPGYWLILEGSPTSASNLEWFVAEFLKEEQKIAEAQGTSVYAVCNNEVKSTSPQESNVFFIPFLYGSNAGQKAKASFIGLAGHHKRADVIRAIYEGIVFSHKTHIGKLLKYRKTPEIIRIAGGAAQSEVWIQMFADILQVPIEVTAGTELGAMGAAICAGAGAGVFADLDEGVNAMVQVKKRVDPDPSLKDVYEKKYQRYHQAISALESFWE